MTLALFDPVVPEALSPSDHYERLFWLTRIADGDLAALAEGVVSRIDFDGKEVHLLRMGPSDQRTVEGYLGKVASRRLAALPIDQRHYTRTVGHPVHAAEEAFEKGGEPSLAAAYCALVHDKLARSAGSGDLAVARAALRFAVARTLVISQPETVEDCRGLVRQTLDTFPAGDEESDTLYDEMTAWLDTDGDPPLALVT